ncbi:MAG: GNAT family N-acetyltransferase [Burkholderiaceae bacterium]
MSLEKLRFTVVSEQDGESLALIRLEAMKESLIAVGRFDPERAKKRFLDTFEVQDTHGLEMDGQRVGFFVLRERDDHLLLDHLYVLPDFQGKGIGAVVLDAVFDRANRAGKPVKLGALVGSRSNDFYSVHGFKLVGQDEFDNYYEWTAF